MESNELNITISGFRCSGKSTVALVIKEALKKHGFHVDFDGGIDFKNESEFDGFIGKEHSKSVKVLTEQKNTKITLRELPLNTNSYHEEHR